MEIELYHVFPIDSTFPPDGRVFMRVNSPSDNNFDARDSNVPGQLSFSVTLLNPSFTAANSVVNGINPMPNQFTGGEGQVTGEEVQFNIMFTTPFMVGADHIFFRPEVLLANGDFLRLSAPKRTLPPGTPFAADLQTWTRTDGPGALAPYWERIGTDITHQGPFNASFSLTGETVPEPASLTLIGTGLLVSGLLLRRRKSTGENGKSLMTGSMKSSVWIVISTVALALTSGVSGSDDWTTTGGAPATKLKLAAKGGVTNEQMIASAISAAPASLSKKATVVAMHADGSMRTLRQGNNGFSCMPDDPGTPGPDPMCLDQNAMEWLHAYFAHAAPPAGKFGLIYMLAGGTNASNTDPFATKPIPPHHWVKTGPHIMIVGADASFYASYPSGPDPDTSVPYVMFAGTPYQTPDGSGEVA